MALKRNRQVWSDQQLLAGIAAGDERAFSAFYRRHLGTTVAWCLRRTGNPELAADLTAEVFAAVLIAARGYAPIHETATGWLLGIARNVLGHSLRRGGVDDRARAQIGATRLIVEDEDLAAVIAIADAGDGLVGDLFAGLPADERAAVHARIVEEREYGEIARSLGSSEMVIRKRVSRGLARLRAGLTTR